MDNSLAAYKTALTEIVSKHNPSDNARTLAFAAIRKQMPHDVIQDRRKGKECYCSVCGGYVGWKDTFDSEIVNYCPDCGNATEAIR